MIYSVLENPWHGSVVLGGNEQQTLCRCDLALQPFDLGRLVAVIILIVEWQVADLQMLERQVGRSKKFGIGTGELCVKRSRRRLPTITAMFI